MLGIQLDSIKYQKKMSVKLRNHVLHLYNTFTKTNPAVKLEGRLVESADASRMKIGTFYICGPTVYDNCHLGHALTYIRADLFRKFLKQYLNVKLVTAMNITDIDDKILLKANLSGQKCNSTNYDDHGVKEISDRYYQSFLDDLDAMGVEHADVKVRVTSRIASITKFISRLERKGFAYRNEEGDVYFNVGALPNYTAVNVDALERVSSLKKRDPRDFVIWKSRKPGEPSWPYHCGRTEVLGRPGWHVQCSAIASSVFGNKLDFHFGGKDLIFPHHYNEAACCYAANIQNEKDHLHRSFDDKQPTSGWCKNWLHSGHLIMKGEKMSKSIGNVMSIKEFIESTSLNSLRLLCIVHHYRTDLEYNPELIWSLSRLDHKLKAFSSFLLSKQTEKQEQEEIEIESNEDENINQEREEKNYYNDEDCQILDIVHDTEEKIIEGICDDFDLSKGLYAVESMMSKYYASDQALSLKQIIAASSLFKRWCSTVGLDLGLSQNTELDVHRSTSVVLKELQKFRYKIREKSLSIIRSSSHLENDNEIENQKQAGRLAKSMLKECDKVRANLDKLGIVIRDDHS